MKNRNTYWRYKLQETKEKEKERITLVKMRKMALINGRNETVIKQQ